jgi:hypothetical protein
MSRETPGLGGPLGPLDLLKILPFEPCASSDRLGWVGLEAARYRAAPASESKPARHDPPHARPFCPAAGGTGPAV